MADYEMFANNVTDMRSAFTAIGIPYGDSKRGAVRYAVKYYGTKYVWDGTRVTDQYGTQVKNMVAQPGVYAIVRWVPASLASNPFPPTGVTLPTGVTVKALPADSPIVFG